jgi:hypothetical protein
VKSIEQIIFAFQVGHMLDKRKRQYLIVLLKGGLAGISTSSRRSAKNSSRPMPVCGTSSLAAPMVLGKQSC